VWFKTAELSLVLSQKETKIPAKNDRFIGPTSTLPYFFGSNTFFCFVACSIPVSSSAVVSLCDWHQEKSQELVELLFMSCWTERELDALVKTKHNERERHLVCLSIPDF
jgi:hypothetical protein